MNILMRDLVLEATEECSETDSCDWLRCRGERIILNNLLAFLGNAEIPSSLVFPEYNLACVRQDYLASSLRLSEASAPHTNELMRLVEERFGVLHEFELYQTQGDTNAFSCLSQGMALIRMQGKMLTLVDDGACQALLGHEYGHVLFHFQPLRLKAKFLLEHLLEHHELLTGSGSHEDFVRNYYAYSQAREITADRCALMACDNLRDGLKLLMILATGLPANSLSWDVEAYRLQCEECVRHVGDAQDNYKQTHPLLAVRAYLMSLFWESDLFREKTGRGPGTRPYAEVEKEVERLLFSRIDFCEDDVPREVLLCALAVCVILAWADGDISEPEEDAIEETFATRVVEYREYFALETARGLFQDVAEAVTALGMEAFQQVYIYAMHVVVADGVIHEAERVTLLELGQALGCAAEWQCWLEKSASARIMGTETSSARRDEVLVRPESVGLKPNKDEIATAIEAFLRPVAKLGGTQTTLRRLLKFLGARADNWRSHIPALQRILDKYGLESSPEIKGDNQSLTYDSSVVLTCDQHKRSSAEQTKATLTSRDKAIDLLVHGVRKLRGELVSGDGRSPSVRLRGEQKGRAFDLTRLDLLSVGRAERTMVVALAGGKASLITPAEAGSSTQGKSVSSALGELAREARMRFEEKGRSDLCLGTSFVKGIVGNYPICAPLILQSVELVRLDGSHHGWELKATTSHCQANLAVLNIIANRSHSKLSDELLDSLDTACEEGAESALRAIASFGFFSAVAVFRDPGAIAAQDAPADSGSASILGDNPLGLAAEDDCASLATPQRSLNTEEDALSLGVMQDALVPLERCCHDFENLDRLCLESAGALGFFPQSSSDLLRDYDDIEHDLLQEQADVGQVLGGASCLLPSSLKESLVIPEDAAPLSEERLHAAHFPTVSLDPSQQVAVNAAASVPSLVVDGPPGTGKSQVIMGMILDAFARGERVAVVSEKRAALDVIAQRLTSQGFGDCYALVHDVEKDRSELYGRIVARLGEDSAVTAEAVEAENSSLATELDVLRQEWEAVHKELALRKDLLVAQIAGDDMRMADLMAFASSLKERLEAVGLGVSASDGGASSAVVALKAGELGYAVDLLQEVSAYRALLNKRSPWYGLPLEWGNWGTIVSDLREFLAETGETATSQLAPEDPNVAGLGTRWLNQLLRARKVRESLDAKAKSSVLFAPWSELKGEITSLLGYRGNIFRWILPSWWRSRRAVSEWLAANYPEESLVKLNGENLQRLLLLSGEIMEFGEGFTKLGGGPDHGAGYLEPRLSQDAVVLERAQLPLERLSHVMPKAIEYVGELSSDERATTPEAWRLLTLYGWGMGKVSASLNQRPELGQFCRPAAYAALDAMNERLRKLEQRISELERQRIHAELGKRGLLGVTPALPRARRSPEQHVREDLLKEVQKKSRRMQMRVLVRKYATSGLLDVLPVWMLSPETVTVLFPRQPVFDLVIFDEASQCTVGGSLPVLMRAKRWVIAGDDKQMPPSSFFKASNDDDDVLESEDSVASKELFDSESLLSLASVRVPHIRLSWHYRCQDESLIAFSNFAFYNGELATAPVPSIGSEVQKLALHWVHTEGGTYEDGCNLVEADKVAEVLDARLRESPNESVGVITFNTKQCAAVLDAIEHRCVDNADFGARYGEAMALSIDRRPFVKSLENVQGDERDHIFFSLGHAPKPRRRASNMELKVPARFGPLGRNGGERRLNVAVSRARLSCTVVASFEPTQLSVGNSKHTGPRLFKIFLEYVWNVTHGEPALARQSLLEAQAQDSSRTAACATSKRKGALDLPEALPLTVQIAVQAEKLGFRMEQEVGSGSFRVPLALFSDAAQPIAVLTDEELSHTSLYDLAVHRVNLLERKGWQVMQVSTPQWLFARDEVLQKLATMGGLRGTVCSAV